MKNIFVLLFFLLGAWGVFGETHIPINYQSCLVDINADRIMEQIDLVVYAEKDKDGNILWDDTQRWVLLVNGAQSVILFDEMITLGSANIIIGNDVKQVQPSILLIKDDDEDFSVFNFLFDAQGKVFTKTVILHVSKSCRSTIPIKMMIHEK